MSTVVFDDGACVETRIEVKGDIITVREALQEIEFEPLSTGMNESSHENTRTRMQPTGVY